LWAYNELLFPNLVREELPTNHEVIFRAANTIAIYRQRTVALRGANAS
jgi:hypothetical protein